MAVQSAVGLADAHSAHQSGIEHLSFEDHQHPDDGNHHREPTELPKGQEQDCHHCCHCHGHASPAIIFSSLGIAFLQLSLGDSAYRVASVPEPLATLLRPPIYIT